MGGNTFNRGSEIVNKLTPNGAQKIMDAHGEIAPDLARHIVEFVFGEIYHGGGLDIKTKQMITITALATIGYAKPQLAYHIKGAINLGITRQEIIDIITHISVYAGFPAALTALTTAKEIFQEIDKNESSEKKSVK